MQLNSPLAGQNLARATINEHTENLEKLRSRISPDSCPEDCSVRAGLFYKRAEFPDFKVFYDLNFVWNFAFRY